MPLSDVQDLTRQQDSSKRTHQALYELYFPSGAPRPNATEFSTVFRERLEQLGLGSSERETIANAFSTVLDAEYPDDPERLAKEFLQAEQWSAQPQLADVDGFKQDPASGRMFLADLSAEVFPHTGYPGQGIFYDRQQRLYKDGAPYSSPSVTPVFRQVDGFAQDTSSGVMYLADQTTEVFPHTGYPADEKIFYDRQSRLYQNGKPYVPEAISETVEDSAEPSEAPANDEIVKLLTDDSNYSLLQRAADNGELTIEYLDEELTSFPSDKFVNID